MPAGSVPKTAYKENYHYIYILAYDSLSASAKRKIKVIPEPCGHRDIPPAPIIADRGGKIGLPEVIHKLKAHNPCGAPGYIGITREITVDLKCEQDCGKR